MDDRLEELLFENLPPRCLWSDHLEELLFKIFLLFELWHSTGTFCLGITAFQELQFNEWPARRNFCFCIKTAMQNRSVLGQLRLWALALDLAPTLQVFSVGGFKNLKTKQKALSKLNLFSLDLTDIAKKIKDLFNEL